MKRRSLLGSFLGALGAASLPKQELLPELPLPTPVLHPSDKPLVSATYTDIASGSDGQVLRRTASGLAWGAVDLADCDAVTGLLPLANLPGVVAWSGDLQAMANDPEPCTGLLPFTHLFGHPVD
jgi:hypothetical protein